MIVQREKNERTNVVFPSLFPRVFISPVENIISLLLPRRHVCSVVYTQVGSVTVYKTGHLSVRASPIQFKKDERYVLQQYIPISSFFEKFCSPVV